MKKTHGRIIAFLMAVILSFSFITYSGVSYTEVSAAAKKTVNIKKPPKPRTSKVKTNSVKLKWGKVKGATSYKVYRSTNKKKWKLIKTTKGTSLTVKKLKANKKYYFRIRAFRNKVKSPYSKIVSVKTKKVAATEKPEANVPQNTTNPAATTTVAPIPTVTAPTDAVVPTAPQQPTVPADTTAPVSTTAPGATETPDTTAPAETETTAPAQSDETTTDPSTSENLPSTKEEIAKAYNDVVNACKSYDGRVTIKESESVSIAITDLPAVAESIVNKIVEGFVGTTERSWTFENNAYVEDPYRDISYVIMPYFAEASVLPEGLASAKATSNDDGGYTLELVFIAEDSVFDGVSTINEPVYHMGALEPLNLGIFDLGPVIIKHADLHYPGATILATVDAQGRLVKLDSLLPVEGSGIGKVGPLSLSINASGALHTVCEMVYE